MVKFKHNKKRNSAFLYEILIHELTRAILAKNENLKNKITNLIKESFSRNSMMYRELKLYRAITHTNNVNILTAEKIINEVKIRHREIDKKMLLSEQNKVAAKIRKFLSKDAFSSFVPNYKNLASISQIFNNNLPIKSKILLENELTYKMTDQKLEEKMVPIDNLIYKSFAKKFNEEYGGNKLLEEQKILLNKFITSFDNNGIEFKTYLNEEIGRLKKELRKSFSKEEFINDSEMVEKVKKILHILESYKVKRPNKEMAEEVIKIQELVKEINLSAN
tara:strand:+ start:287 stop:1117 length:831 start_codon:yes stop_codon:yes gene_type:complete